MVTRITATKTGKIVLTCLLVLAAGTMPCWALRADINYDSKVNLLDLAVLAGKWLETGQQELPPTRGTATYVVAASTALDSARTTFDDGLKATIDWYKANRIGI